MTSDSNTGATVSIHQPNFLPWLGYFAKMIESDVFVYLDSVQYPRGQSFAARNRIKTPNGPLYITVPVSVPSGNDGQVEYRDVRLAGDKWKKKVLRTLEMNYRKAPSFDDVMQRLAPVIDGAESFVDMNIGLIDIVAEYLGIPTRRVRLSELLQGDFGRKTGLIVDICQALGAGTYLSGKGGGQSYNQPEMLQEAGIRLRYSRFEHPVYSQLWGEFEPNLSIVDLLFNHGSDSRAILDSALPAHAAESK